MRGKMATGFTTLIFGIFLLFLSSPSIAAEYRCGWLENPTPANWWLNDKDGSWTISAQGGYSVPDKSIDNLPNINDKDFVRTNGNYGYTCACMSVTLDKKNERVTAIHKKGKQLSLKKCLEDRNLPGRDDWNKDEAASNKVEYDDHANLDYTPHYIQVLTTSDTNKANKLKSTLKQKGFETAVTPFKSNGRTLYRVRVGSYAGKDAAVHFQTQLKASFKNNPSIQKSIIVKETSTDKKTTQQAAPPIQQPQCYSKKEGNDLTAIELSETQGKVSGYYTWAPYESDGAYGSFTGTKTGNQIRALYTFMIEGDTQTEEIVFKVGNNVLIQGQGEMIDKKEGQFFKDPTKLEWKAQLAKVDCSTVKTAINNAKQTAIDIKKGFSTNDSGQQMVTSSDNVTYAVTYNENGAVLTSQDKKIIYLGKDCDTSSKTYGKGKWDWANGGFTINLKNKNIGFPRQELFLSDIGKCRS